MQQLKEYFERIPGALNTWGNFAEKLDQCSYDKAAFILKAGQVENFLYFLEEGIVRLWVERDEKETTFDFAFKGNFTSAYSSFLTRTPSVFNVQALTAVSIWRIAYEALQELYQTSTQGQLIGRLAAEQLFMHKSKRELSLLTETAEERYLHLLEQQPELIMQIPLKYLASYIGITPQALSRIRQRIS